jgi:hypothetical protein
MEAQMKDCIYFTNIIKHEGVNKFRTFKDLTAK